MFHTFTLETAWIQPWGWRMLYMWPAPAFIHHKIRGTMEVSHRSSSQLLILSAPPHRPSPTPFAQFCIRGACSATDKRTAGEACLPAQAMSFTPSWALSITPQRQSLRETGGEITSPALKRPISSPRELTAVSVVLKTRAPKNKGFTARSWNQSQKLICFRFWSRIIFITPPQKKKGSESNGF